MKIGYARVLADDQRSDIQEVELKAAGCELVYSDFTRDRTSGRPQLVVAIEHLREGDTFVVLNLDRLGRSVKQLAELVSDFENHGVNFVSITDSIDTSTPTGNRFFHITACLAAMEGRVAVEGTKAGLEAARQEGRHGGRKPIMSDEKIATARQLLAGGTSPRKTAESICVSTATLYRWIPGHHRIDMIHEHMQTSQIICDK